MKNTTYIIFNFILCFVCLNGFTASTQLDHLTGGTISSKNHHFSFGLTCEDDLDHPSMCINHIRIGAQNHELSISENILDFKDIEFKKNFIKFLSCELKEQNNRSYQIDSKRHFFSAATEFYLTRKKIEDDKLSQTIISHLLEGNLNLDLKRDQFTLLYYALDAKSYSGICETKEISLKDSY